MKKWEYIFSTDQLTTPSGKTITVPDPLVSNLITSKFWVGVIAGYPYSINNENVIALTQDGEPAWQIEKCKETSGNKLFHYKWFVEYPTDNRHQRLNNWDHYENNVAYIRNWNHCVISIDLTTGKVVESIDLLPDWKTDIDVIICPDGSKIQLPFEIMDYDLIRNNLLVLLRPPDNVIMTENAFLISPSGKIIWQIGKRKETDKSIGGLVNGYKFFEDENMLRLFSPSGFVTTVEPDTGKIVQVEFLK